MLYIFVVMISDMIGAAVRVPEPILWEFEATPGAIIFRLLGASNHLK